MQFIGSVGHYFTPGATWTISWTRGTVRGRWAAVGRSKKFGFRGKKRDVKKNDKRSTDDVSSFRPGQKTRPGGKGKGGAGSKARPGKGTRQKMKNRKKA